MMKNGFFLFSLLLCLSFGAHPMLQSQEESYRIIGYYTFWSINTEGYAATDIPADQLTHINYAFMTVMENGGCALPDPYSENFIALQTLHAENPHLTLMLSIGGEGGSEHFSGIALTAQSRERFVRSCVALMRSVGFDGIDVDWEFPVEGALVGRPEDKRNFTLLLAEFRRQLDEWSELDQQVYYLSIAAPAIRRFYDHIEIDQIHGYLDWINLMGYGYAGRWSDITNHDSRLYASLDDPNAGLGRNTNSAVQVYLAAGVPAEKIVIGVPFYGRGWGGVSAEHDGLYQPFDAPTQPQFIPYRDLVDSYLPTFSRYWDSTGRAAWLYDPARRITISYEDPQALQAKADYIQQMHLGGVMIWELSFDTDDHILLTTLHDGLSEP